jgi:diacylglycerol kinase (ATP)
VAKPGANPAELCRPSFQGAMNDTHSPHKSKGGLGRLGGAVRYSLQGLGAAIRHEAAFRQELCVAVILTPVAFWLGNTLIERILLVAAVFLVLIVELLNSGMEALADAITLNEHPLIGRAKDLGSAAVMLSIVLACIIWLAVIANHT